MQAFNGHLYIFAHSMCGATALVVDKCPQGMKCKSISTIGAIHCGNIDSNV